MSALVAPILDAVAAASEPPAAIDSPYSVLYFKDCREQFQGSYEAQKKSWQRWRDEQRKDQVSPDGGVRGDALHNGEPMQDKVSRTRSFFNLPDRVRRGLPVPALAREMAARRFYEVRRRIAEQQPHLGETESQRVIDTAIPRCSEDIAAFDLPLSRTQLALQRDRILKGERCFDRVGKCGRKRKAADPRLLAVVNDVYLKQGRSREAAFNEQLILAKELGIDFLTKDQVRKYTTPGSGFPGGLTAHEIKIAREGEKALSEDMPCILRDPGEMDFLELGCMDGSPFQFTIEWTDAHGELHNFTYTWLLVIDFHTRIIVADRIVAGERWEEVVGMIRDLCRKYWIPGGIYFDYASSFRKALGDGFKQLETALTKHLKIKIINSIPGRPKSRGIIERFNQTWQRDMVPAYLHSLNGAKPTLETLRAFATHWLENVYHETSHAGEGMGGLSPRQKLDQWKRNNPDAQSRRVDEETLGTLSGTRSKPISCGKNGMRYKRRLFGHFDERYMRVRNAGLKTAYLLEWNEADKALLCNEDCTPIHDPLTKLPIVLCDKVYRGTTQDDVRQTITVEKRAKRAAEESLKAREYRTLLPGQRVQYVKAQREEEHRKLGAPPEPQTVIAATAFTSAAQSIESQRKSKSPSHEITVPSAHEQLAAMGNTPAAEPPRTISYAEVAASHEEKPSQSLSLAALAGITAHNDEFEDSSVDYSRFSQGMAG